MLSQAERRQALGAGETEPFGYSVRTQAVESM
jgi:hypothetical protein